MNSNGRRETVVALVCAVVLPWWVWVTGLSLHEFWLAVLSVVLGVGIVSGVGGMRRGGLVTRVVAAGCVVILTVVAGGFVILVRNEAGR